MRERERERERKREKKRDHLMIQRRKVVEKYRVLIVNARFHFNIIFQT